MTLMELGKILNEMYEQAIYGEKVASIHLFAIKYACVIKDNNYKAKEIIQASGIKKSYTLEINAGLKLSKYVKVKSNEYFI